MRFEKLTKAKNTCKNFTPEQRTLIEECLKTEYNHISDCFEKEEQGYEVNFSTADIKNDFFMSGLESELFNSEDEFNTLYKAVSTVHSFEAMAYC